MYRWVAGSYEPGIHTCAPPRRVQARPGFQPGIPRVHRHRVELPLQVARRRVEGLQEARRVQVVTRAHQHMIADDHRAYELDRYRSHFPVPPAGTKRRAGVTRKTTLGLVCTGDVMAFD